MIIGRKIKMVKMPNFLSFEQKAGKREDGFKTNDAIDVGDLTSEEAEQFSDEMKQAFIDHWDSLHNS
jgi:hypothetical protein